jgi:glycine/D-amino acid oxidase-like deaminating enzyme
MGYVRGLSVAANNAGAKIHTDVKVTKLHKEGDKWVLQTTKGVVRAKSVVLGTNAYTDELWPGLKESFTKIHFFQVASKPLGDKVKHILPEGQGLWDTGQIMFSLRRDQFGRIIIGSMGKLLGKDSGMSHKWAQHNLSSMFPELGQLEWETSWDGQIAMTSDHLPRIHRLSDGLYTPIGYNGRGITPGTIFGKAMADLLSGGDEEKLPLPVTGVKKASSAIFMSNFYELAFKANQIYKSYV